MTNWLFYFEFCTFGFRGDCIVPPKPKNGKYLYKNISTEAGRKIPEYNALQYVCNENYLLSSSQGFAFCSNGKWNPETIECYGM